MTARSSRIFRRTTFTRVVNRASKSNGATGAPVMRHLPVLAGARVE